MMALEKISKYDKEKSQFSTWLFTIAKNITLQNIKEQKRNVSMDNEIDSDGTTMKDFIEGDIYDEDTNAQEDIIDERNLPAGEEKIVKGIKKSGDFKKNDPALYAIARSVYNKKRKG